MGGARTALIAVGCAVVLGLGGFAALVGVWKLTGRDACLFMDEPSAGDCGIMCLDDAGCDGFGFEAGPNVKDSDEQGKCMVHHEGCHEKLGLDWDYYTTSFQDARKTLKSYWQREGMFENDEKAYAEQEFSWPEEDLVKPATDDFAAKYFGTGSPQNITRDTTVYDWCPVGDGLASVTFWPENRREDMVTVTFSSVRWVRWQSSVTRVSWQCDGSRRIGTTTLSQPLAREQWLSLQLLRGKRAGVASFFQPGVAGRLKWNTWKATDYISTVPFTSGTEGYACFKIPAYLRTAANTVLAFVEARHGVCGDFDETDLVVKRSTDGGLTWGNLTVIGRPHGDSSKLGICGNSLVVGNVAPVQLREDSKHHAGRILAPHTRNNYETWVTYSDDDGVTWSEAKEIPKVGAEASGPDCERGMSFFGLPGLDNLNLKSVPDVLKWVALLCAGSGGMNDPFKNARWNSTLTGSWQFIGTGPPGSIQLQTGRVLVPAYHSYIRGLADGVSQLYNNFALGHTIISDDGGDSWRLGWQGRTADGNVGQGLNENSLVEFADGSVLSNSRSLSTGSPQFRVQTTSVDAGESFTASTFARDLPQPFNGCQGSSVGGGGDVVFTAQPDPDPAESVAQKLVDHLPRCDVKLSGRTRVSVWKSTDRGQSYSSKVLIDEGRSAQTALQWANSQLTLLYEQADPPPKTPREELLEHLIEDLVILIPDRFVFREVNGI